MKLSADEAKQAIDAMTTEEQLVTAIILAATTMDKLSREQRFDLMMAALQAHKMMSSYHLLKALTAGVATSTQASAELPRRIEHAAKRISESIRPDIVRFFNLTEMLK